MDAEIKDPQTQQEELEQEIIESTEGEDDKNSENTPNEEIFEDITQSEANVPSNDSSDTVANRLSLDPSYTDEELNAIKVLKEARLAKIAKIADLRKAYAQALDGEQKNENLLNELSAQIDFIKLEIDEIDASIKAIEAQAYAKSDSFKPITSVLKHFRKPLITEYELIDELGANEIRALSDIHGEGIWNRKVIDDAISDAQGLISSFFKIPSTPTLFLRDICTKLTIVELKRRNSYPREELEAIKNECIGYLNKMASGKIPTSIEDEANEIRANSRAFIHTRTRLKLGKMYD